MSILLPGYQRLAEQERARQVAVHKLDHLPWEPSFAAGRVHVVSTRGEADSVAEQLRRTPVSLLGVDTEFRFDRPPVPLPGGGTFVDPASVRPLVCSVAAWCDADDAPPEGRGGLLLQFVFDLRRPGAAEGLKAVFDLHVPWVCHSARAELHTLWACGVEPPEHLLIDTYITACCLNAGRYHRRNVRAAAGDDAGEIRRLAERSAHVTSLVGECEAYGIDNPFAPLKDQMRERFLRLGPDDPLDELMAAYAASDAEFALRVHLAQQRDVQRQGLLPHLSQVEWPCVAALARMEYGGVPVDLERAARYRELCRRMADRMAEQLAAMGIRAGSRDSFLRAMREAGLARHFVRDGKETTCREVLRECERHGVHDAVRPFRLHRHFEDLAGDMDRLPQLVSGDGRIRCSLAQVGSASGRIASKWPNLIGMDARLRPVVTAPGARVLVEIDYSQIEPGLAGAEWGDTALVALFNSEDCYAAVAQSFFRDHLTDEERSLSVAEFKRARPDLRKRAKALLLGVLYGKGAPGLAADLGCTVEQAQAELDRFFSHFPQAAVGAERAIEGALRRGYGVTATGLRRFVGRGDRSQRNALRNHPIQGVAAATFKAAIRRIDGHYRGTGTRLLLPRHDSILIETPAETREEVVATCTRLMVGAVREKYPQLRPRVEAKWGPSWPTEQTLEDYYRREVGEDGPPPSHESPAVTATAETDSRPTDDPPRPAVEPSEAIPPPAPADDIAGSAVDADIPVSVPALPAAVPPAMPSRVVSPAERALRTLLPTSGRVPLAVARPASQGGEAFEGLLGRVHCGDCVEFMAGLPDASVDIIPTDPPFNVGYGYDVYRDNLRDPDYFDFTRSWLSQVHRILKPDGTCWVAINDQYVAEIKVIATRELGFHLRSWVVWYTTFSQNAKGNFGHSKRHLLYLVKDPKRFVFNADDPDLRVPSTRQLIGDRRANADGRLPDDTWILRPEDHPGSFPADADTWCVSRVNGTFNERVGWHPCQMPEQVLGRILRATSRPTDVVYEPFVGSGTTLAAAKKLGRRFFGSELSAEYALKSQARVDAIAVGDPLCGTDVSMRNPPVVVPRRRAKGSRGDKNEPAP